MRIRPVINTLRNFKAVNYQSPIQRVMDTTTKEHKLLQAEIKNYIQNPVTIFSQINGSQFMTEQNNVCQVSPLYSHPVVSMFNYLGPQPILSGIEKSEKAKKQWLEVPIENRMEIMLKIADLIENKYFYKMLAATMVGQGKTIYEANIDAIQETIDFLRFNVDFSLQILKKQPISTENITNVSLYQPLQGVVASYTPFNFTAIAANLATAPLIWGNSVFWKPSEKAMLSNHLFYEICLEAGVHHNILNFVITEAGLFTNAITNNNKLGAVLFTGSSFGYNSVLEKVHTNYYNKVLNFGAVRKDHIKTEYTYPRCIGETGGQNFHFVDTEANMDLVVEKTMNSAFGYSGQKCSACSRLYLPRDKWAYFISEIEKKIVETITPETHGVIGTYSYYELDATIRELKNSPSVEVFQFSENDESISYFISPTIVLCHSADETVLKDEFLGPILGVRLYAPHEKNEAIRECQEAVPYALTGAIFSENDEFLEHAVDLFSNNCGNMYINDQSTGAVVGQQPFGGFKASGTNDKAGDMNFMLRLCNQQNIKINNYV